MIKPEDPSQLKPLTQKAGDKTRHMLPPGTLQQISQENPWIYVHRETGEKYFKIPEGASPENQIFLSHLLRDIGALPAENIVAAEERGRPLQYFSLEKFPKNSEKSYSGVEITTHLTALHEIFSDHDKGIADWNNPEKNTRNIKIVTVPGSNRYYVTYYDFEKFGQRFRLGSFAEEGGVAWGKIVDRLRAQTDTWGKHSFLDSLEEIIEVLENYFSGLEGQKRIEKIIQSLPGRPPPVLELAGHEDEETVHAHIEKFQQTVLHRIHSLKTACNAVRNNP